MIKGTLSKNSNNEWVVIENSSNDYYTTHPQHKLWLMIHGNEGMKVRFTFDNEYQAILESCESDMYECI